MEGMLYKWTNYISGWQPRWFVLEGDTLSYYDSQEDVWKGCKGSIKISVCEIQVHFSDSTRVDLTIPGEQYFYLRAINAAQRQKWLVALGTAKACLTDNRTKREKELQENAEALKIKMSELRIYCDLLLQQVTKIKDGSQAELPAAAAEEEEEGEAVGTLVKTTCTTFLKTLEECMLIASRTFSSDLLTQTPPASPPVLTIKPHKVKFASQSSQNSIEKKKERKRSSGSVSGSELLESLMEGPTSLSSSPENTKTQPEGIDVNKGPVRHAKDVDAQQQVPQLADGGQMEAMKQKEAALPDQDLQDRQEVSPVLPRAQEVISSDQGVGEVVDPTKPQTHREDPEQVETFFSTMSHRFSDIELEEDAGIPTRPFLDSCYAIVPVLDKLGPTVFAPVKMDFVGNIKKVHQKFLSDPERFPTLQAIVMHELETEVAQVRNSATEALLWLKRGLKFLKEFLWEVKQGERDIPGALNNAYGKTLRQYHGWVVRGVFALALRAAPSYRTFMGALVSREGDELKEGFVSGMHRDLGTYLPAMERQLGVLDTLYDEYGLESDEVV
ncbi:pleckstrin homology domain-containing family A member 8 isoform X1 [Paramormyrops kingsleyae]|uniref:pleckstrin homology domain-containing family A member 8 isoform X1 n=1 Tax=Paramormyrops kingsleyae TaxID=1676925 RepID=UPI003B9762E1